MTPNEFLQARLEEQVHNWLPIHTIQVQILALYNAFSQRAAQADNKFEGFPSKVSAESYLDVISLLCGQWYDHPDYRKEWDFFSLHQIKDSNADS